MLVEYQALCRAPEQTLRYLYEQIGVPYFPHDFENVEYEQEEFDVALGTRGLHSVRRRVEWIDRATVLPPELFAHFENDALWREPEADARGVAMIRAG